MRIKKELSEKNIDQIIAFTNSDVDVQRFTSDLNRFKDKDTLKEWLKKGREIYVLVDDLDNLMGISWFGPESKGFTFAIRIYGEARGKGLSANFLQETMADYVKKTEFLNAKCRDIWLETSDDNYRAIKIYEKLGFVKTGMGTISGKSIYLKKN